VNQIRKAQVARRPTNTVRAASARSRKTGTLLPSILVLLMLIIMTVPPGLDYRLEVKPAEGDSFSLTIWMVLLFGSTYLVIKNWRQVRELLAAVNRPFFYFLVLASLSLLWSIEPDITLRRILRLYIIVLVSVAFASAGWQPRRFENSLRWLLFLLLAASAIFCYWNPDLAIHHDEGHAELMDAWHGITTGKNVLGSLASCAFILWLHGLLAGETGRVTAIANLALAGLCLVMCRSSTSIMATAFAAFFVILLLRPPGSMRRLTPYMVGFFASSVLVYALAVLNILPGLSFILTPISMISGKDLTFSGRTNIWYLLKLHIRQHPLLGTGYEAYWIGPVPSSPSYDMINQLFFYPTEGHNGYLDVINDLGYVGFACLLAYFIVYLRQGLNLMRLEKARGALYLALIFRAFLADMSESHWFSVTSIDFVIFTLATFSLARELLFQRKGSPEAVRDPADSKSRSRRTFRPHALR
jgi:exopolysaccharide production protein ExoQ